MTKTKKPSQSADLLSNPPVVKAKSTGGRPRLNLSPDWIEQLASQGMRSEKIAQHLRISRKTVDARLADDPEVAAAFAEGNFQWTEKLLGVTDKLLDAILARLDAGQPLTKAEIVWLIFLSKQPHGADWKDQQELEHTGGITITVQRQRIGDDGEVIDITPGNSGELAEE